MTTAIAQFMRQLERVWDGHREALLGRRDLEASLAPLTAEPSVLHIPAMTGAVGGQAVRRFYTEDFLPHLPARPGRGQDLPDRGPVPAGR